MRAVFEDLDSGKAKSEPVLGRFQTAPHKRRRDIRFLWSGDTAGQGSGIDLGFAPMRWHTQDESERVYRHIPYGKDLDVFVLDMRSYRGPNGCNREPAPGPETAFLGRAQLEWLKQKLQRSHARWKVIAADMPIGLLVGDSRDPVAGRDRFENGASGDARCSAASSRSPSRCVSSTELAGGLIANRDTDCS